MFVSQQSQYVQYKHKLLEQTNKQSYTHGGMSCTDEQSSCGSGQNSMYVHAAQHCKYSYHVGWLYPMKGFYDFC
jgi:hypothetical protein